MFSLFEKILGSELDGFRETPILFSGTTLTSLTSQLTADTSHPQDISHSCRRARDPPTRGCLGALRSASSRVEPLTAIIPGQHADLCSSGNFGEIAYFHVTRNDQSSLTMNITVWNYTP